MAQKVNIILVDDLDGSENASETVTFGLDGVNYEIDLTEKNAAKLRKALDPFVPAARKVSGRRTSGTGSGKKSSGPKASEVRAWAQQNGMEVPDRGRIPAEVQEAFDAAH